MDKSRNPSVFSNFCMYKDKIHGFKGWKVLHRDYEGQNLRIQGLESAS
jgi:hypothetical protein